MSANNIVVIIKGDDGKFRAFHRDYDAHLGGLYNSHSISEGIFQADSCEEAICKYEKWLDSMNDGEGGFPFTVEYGYVFEGLVPNKLTAETLEKSERGEEVHTLLKEDLVDEIDKYILRIIKLFEGERNKVKELRIENKKLKRMIPWRILPPSFPSPENEFLKEGDTESRIKGEEKSDKMVIEVIDGVKVIYPRDAIEGFHEEHGIYFRAEIRNYIVEAKKFDLDKAEPEEPIEEPGF